MRERDDEARRKQLLKDPRREPTDPPPANKSEQEAKPPPIESDEAQVQVEAKPTQAAAKPKQAKATPLPNEADDPPSSRRRALPRDIPMASDGGGSVITSQDPRVKELEPLVAAADWEAVLRMLGSEEDAGKLPPNLGLLYALAYKEKNVETDGDKGAATKKDSDYDANVVAIRCMAGLFGLPPESPIALVLGKRLIRSNPVGWQKKKAPPAHISVLIVALGLAIGAGIGWLLSFGYVTFNLPTLPF